MHGSADRLDSDRNWKDLTLNFSTRFQLNEIVNWWESKEKLKKGFGQSIHFTRGLFLLFEGPAGTGKRTSAILLGKRLNLPVYRIDLKKLLHPDIGETEKSLARTIEKLERKNCIILFEETGAVVTQTEISKDRNDGKSSILTFLLQRLDDHPGLVIFSSQSRMLLADEMKLRFHRQLDFNEEGNSI